MYNFSLLVAGIAGMVTLDIFIRAFIKSWKEVLGEASCLVLLVIISILLSSESVKEEIGNNSILWGLSILALAVIIIMVGVHLVEVVGTDRKHKYRDNNKENHSKTPVKKTSK